MKVTRGVLLGRWGIALIGLTLMVGSASAEGGTDTPQMCLQLCSTVTQASFLMLGAFF